MVHWPAGGSAAVRVSEALGSHLTRRTPHHCNVTATSGAPARRSVAVQGTAAHGCVEAALAAAAAGRFAHQSSCGQADRAKGGGQGWPRRGLSVPVMRGSSGRWGWRG